MIISKYSEIKDNKLNITEQMMNLLFMEPNQKVYVYCDVDFNTLLVSTIKLSDYLYYFRIPFMDEQSVLSKITGEFAEHNFNIIKNDDVSFGKYAVLHIWAFSIGKYSNNKEFDNNLEDLIKKLKNLMPKSLINDEPIWNSFQERKFILLSEPNIILENMIEEKITKDNSINMKIINKILKNDKTKTYKVICTCYDEFPLLLVQILSENTILVQTTIKLYDKPGTLSKALKYLSKHIFIKASNGLVVKPDKNSIWNIYGLIKNKDNYIKILKKAVEKNLILDYENTMLGDYK